MTSKIYLISPPKINIDRFSRDLEQLLNTGYVSAFQLRLKGYNDVEVEKIAKILFDICYKNNCLFILNDHLDIALRNNFDGVHLGQEDLQKVNIVRNSKYPKNFIIGISCYDSLDLALKAENIGVNYISFGAFFPTKTKEVIAHPNPQIISQFNKKSSLPVVAIGGINDRNCVDLVKNGADFLAVISYIWDSDDKISSLGSLHHNIKLVFDGK